MTNIIPSSEFIILEKIEISNYKTYLNQELPFKNSITTLVGPNESGKTNLLESINFIKEYRKIKKTH